MASITVGYDIELNKVTAIPSTVTLLPDEVLTFTTNSGHFGTITISGFTTAVFTSGSSLSLTGVGASGSRTVKSAPSYITFSLTASQSGATKAISVTVQENLDSTPDPFSLGSDITDAELSAYTSFPSFNVSGINTATSVQVTNGETRVGNSGGFTSYSKQANNGDTIQVRSLSSGSYNTAITTTLTIGGVSDSVTVTTRATADPGLTITSGLVSPYSFQDVVDFFGGVAPHILSAYVRNGSYVPDLPGNSGISNVTAGLQLSQFASSVTAITMNPKPVSLHDNYDTMAGASTRYLSLSMGTEYDFLYGLGSALEKKYTFTGDAGITVLSGSTSWGLTNNLFQVSFYAPAVSEGFATGTLTMDVRHPVAPTQTYTITVPVTFNYYGP